MQTSLRQVEELATRIERAYLLRRPGWVGAGPSSTVWTLAATNLIKLHGGDPRVPIDPELFVASQPEPGGPPDPWHELTEPAALKRYQRRIRRIIIGLRAELREEISRGTARLRKGASIDSVLGARTRSLSPLGRFILAIRAGRPDLADRFREDAQAQHRACPLYRIASRGLLPPNSYPVLNLLPGMEFRVRDSVTQAPVFSLN